MLKALIDSFIKMVFPNHCLCCDKLITGDYFCKDCDGLVKPIDLKTCKKCGHPMKLCSCKWNFYYFDGIIGCFENDNQNKTSFYRFKFGANFKGGEFFARHLIERINQRYGQIEFDYITCVPADKTNRHTRKYNHLEFLTKKVAEALKIKRKRLLSVAKSVPKQHKTKTFNERYDNVNEKYSAVKNVDLKSKRVLLIDDIKTTGATLSECARQLKLKGATEVFAAVALVTYPVKNNNDNLIEKSD